MSDKYESTSRTTLKRRPHRGVYDKSVIHAILDQGYMCNVSYIHEGSPMVLPTGYGRIGDNIYIHGSNQSTMLRAALSGEVCVLVTQIDGLVLGRALYNHSVNYRSVVIFGNPEEVTDKDEKCASFEAYARHVLPGRFGDVRPPNDKELNSTTVMRISITEAVAKMRSGPPTDFDHDLNNDCWAGELLIKQVYAGEIRDPNGRQDVPTPAYITNYEVKPVVESQKVSNSADSL